MSIPARCPYCGYTWDSRLVDIGANARVTIENVGITCPRCRQRGFVEDGTYDAIGKILEAVRAPGVSPDSVAAFRDVAKAAAAGHITPEEAAARVAQIGSIFEELWRWLVEHNIKLDTLLNILMVFLTIYAVTSSDAAEERHRTDWQTLLRSSEMIQSTQDKIYSELHNHAKIPGDRDRGSVDKALPLARTPAAVKQPPNRHERRKAARLARGHPSGRQP